MHILPMGKEMTRVHYAINKSDIGLIGIVKYTYYRDGTHTEQWVGDIITQSLARKIVRFLNQSLQK